MGPVSLVHSTTRGRACLYGSACNSNIRVRVYLESDIRTYNIAVSFFDTCFHKTSIQLLYLYDGIQYTFGVCRTGELGVVS